MSGLGAQGRHVLPPELVSPLFRPKLRLWATGLLKSRNLAILVDFLGDRP